MLLTLHDANLNKVAFIDNDKSGTLNYFDDTWTRDLETGSSTFEFSIYKKSLKSDTAYKKAYNYLNERAFVSFVYKGQTYLFNVMTVEEDETTIQCYCENLNLELINEYANPYKAEKAMSFVEYCNAMDLLNMTKLTVGRNEISDYRRTLEWEGQDTKLARLLSLANKFDAEIDFETILNDDSSLKSFKVNVYHENDDTHQGVGRVRSDIRLTYGKNLKSITRKVDKTGIFNMIVPTSSKTVEDDTVDTGESSSKTVTTTNADGSITKTTTKKASDGTTVQTKVTTKVVENADGSKVTTVRTEKSDGSITEKVTTKSANGNTDTVTKTIREATKENVETVDEYITIAGLPDWEIKNDEGVVEFYKRGGTLYAPISARLYPSTFTTATQSDQWIRHDMSFDVDSDTKLETEALKQLKANAYPALTYTIKGYIDADIGDTLSMSDSGFVPTLLLTARVSNQKLSFTQPSKNETTLANFKALESGLTDDIQSRLEELIESSKPYTIRIASTNGTTFKNNVGESTITATLLKGDKTVSADVTWRWALDGNVTVATQYLVAAKNIEDTAVLTVAAYIGNNEVAVEEVDLTNVNDGLSGSKGDDGVGIDRVSNYYLATAQLNSIEPLGDNLLVSADTFNDWISVSGGDGTATVIDVDEAPLDEVTKAIRVVDNTTGNKDSRHKNALSLEVGEQYTISCFARVASDSPKSSVTLLMRSWTTNDTNRKLSTAISHTDWQFYSFTFTADTVSNFIQFGQTGAGIIEICAPRLVKNQKSYGWTSLTQIITESSRYLWHYRVEHYTDNTEKATAPTIIGVYGNKGDKGDTGPQGIQGLQGPKGDQGIQGPKGADGKTQYTHIAYADSATGGGFSQTDQTKPYIGMYQDFSATDSNDPTKYRWTKWKGSDGAQGIPGKAGADGKTPYIHFAYASSADGKTNFSLTDKNQQYQGYYSDYTEADSTDYKKYTWVDRLANVQVGTRNLWIQSKATGGFVEEILPDNHITGQKKCYRISNNQKIEFNIEPDFSSRLYQKVTFSAWIKYENVVQGANNWNRFDVFKHTLYLKNSSTGATSSAFYNTFAELVGTSDWKYVTYTYDYAANKSYDQLKASLCFVLEGVRSGTAWVTGIMVQFGNVATGHVWAPEDTQDQIDSKADSALTQEQLNALEAKRLQMETEMKALATLQQVSELETFINNLKQEDSDGRQKIIEITKAIEERVKEIEPIMEYSQKLKFMDTYITQGNGGMIIGANDSTTKVVVTPDRISFQSGGSEVAYISQRMLHIDNGVFTMSLQLGHYITRAHPKNEYVNATYFVK